jgi:hypothetical protein
MMDDVSPRPLSPDDLTMAELGAVIETFGPEVLMDPAAWDHITMPLPTQLGGSVVPIAEVIGHGGPWLDVVSGLFQRQDTTWDTYRDPVPPAAPDRPEVAPPW